MPVRGGGRHPGPQAGERAGTAAHHDGVEIGHRQLGIGERGQHVGREPLGVRPGVDGDPLGETVEIVTRTIPAVTAGVAVSRARTIEAHERPTPRSRSARRSG